MITLLSCYRRIASICLGLFVLAQIFFLISNNLLRMLGDSRPYLRNVDIARQIAPDWVEEKGTLHAALTTVENADYRWGQLTGQPQHWSLFAPSVHDHASFPVIVLRWEDERSLTSAAAGLLGQLSTGATMPNITAVAARQQVLTVEAPSEVALNSDNEPKDRHSFFRVGQFRLRRYESQISVILATRDQPLEKLTDAWRGRIESYLREENEQLHAYLRWRLDAFQRDHPELPTPRQVVLFMRVYRVPAPPGPDPWDWQVQSPQPVVRWLPDAEPGPDYYSLEMYNPVVSRFERLRK